MNEDLSGLRKDFEHLSEDGWREITSNMPEVLCLALVAASRISSEARREFAQTTEAWKGGYARRHFGIEEPKRLKQVKGQYSAVAFCYTLSDQALKKAVASLTPEQRHVAKSKLGVEE